MIINPQKKALIIGISDYTNLEQLDFCKNDGMEVYNVLSSHGYDISDKNKLVGEVSWENVRNTIYDFFGDIESNPDDTLLFYYSGHGVLDDDGEIYLASSDIDPDEPYRKGFSFEELTKMVRKSVPIGVVVILDCCYSGSAKIGKGGQEDAARRGRITIEEKSRKLSEVQGKYILSASQASQEAYALKEEDHSIYTSYLLKGLRGKSIDGDGNVTPPSLYNYVYREIMSLPHNRRPRQRPGIQGSGNIVLVSYPNLRTPLPVSPTMSIPNNHPTKSSEAEVHREILGSKSKILMVVLATVIVIALTFALFNYNHSSTTTTSTPVTSRLITNTTSNVMTATHYSLKQVWSKKMTGNGQFNLPIGVAVDHLGNVFVADRANNRIQKFDNTGKFITKWGSSGSDDRQFSGPNGVAVDSNRNIYVADTGNNRIQKFSSNGTFITSWGSYGSGNYQFESPLYLAVDHSDNVYVADNGNDRIQKFSSNGTFITSWGGLGPGNGQFKEPGGIAVDSAGNVYVTDYDNNRVQKFDNTGKFIAEWGTFGSGNAQFFGPVGVAVDSSGNVYVTDTVNNRIQIFSPTR